MGVGVMGVYGGDARVLAPRLRRGAFIGDWPPGVDRHGGRVMRTDVSPRSWTGG